MTLRATNSPIQPPWSNYFVDVFSRAAKQLIESTQYDIERVSIPNFYFTNLVQRACIEGPGFEPIKTARFFSDRYDAIVITPDKSCFKA